MPAVISAVKLAPMKSPAVEPTAVEPTAVKTAAVKTAATVCSVGQGRLGDDRNAQNGGGDQPQGRSAIGPSVCHGSCSSVSAAGRAVHEAQMWGRGVVRRSPDGEIGFNQADGSGWGGASSG